MAVCQVWFLRRNVVVRIGMSPGTMLEDHSQPRVEVATLRTTSLLTEIEAAVSKFHRC